MVNGERDRSDDQMIWQDDVANGLPENAGDYPVPSFFFRKNEDTAMDISGILFSDKPFFFRWEKDWTTHPEWSPARFG